MPGMSDERRLLARVMLTSSAVWLAIGLLLAALGLYVLSHAQEWMIRE
jgi:hypothetical protein